MTFAIPRRDRATAARSISCLTLLVLLSLSSACSTIRVSNDFDSTVDFPAIKAVAWAPSMLDNREAMKVDPVPEKAPRAGNDIDRGRVEAAIADFLPTRDVRLVDGENESADCWVRFALAYRKRHVVSQIGPPAFQYGLGCGFGGGYWNGFAYPGRFAGRGYYSPAWFYGGPFAGFGADTFVREYDTERLQIELVDPKSKKVLWWGAAEDSLVDDKSPAARTARIRKMVGLILDRFPPR